MTAQEKVAAFIKEYLKPLLKKAGYPTAGQKWWKDSGNFFIVMHLVKSSYNSASEVGVEVAA